MGRTRPGQTRQRVLAFVTERLLAGSPPTVREVQQAMGFRSVGSAREHLDALIASGQLARAGDGRHRGLRLMGMPPPDAPGRAASRPNQRRAPRPQLVPLLGRVQAGPLTEALQDVEDYLVVQSRLPAGELFALRIRGDSMVPELLADDVVIVRRQPDAGHGDLVVALVDGDATIKRLRSVRGRIELHATNPRYAPIVPDPAALQLLGKVVELRRRFDQGGGQHAT